ncbi:hypothetical protein VCRA2119O147_350010 [Vibrio crassostreae]|nr:hypothetical protein VCRA2119O147_350010 [Vibrio crassostreae]CAK2816505.1 hypothetical protein VCRA2110O183_320009 [Vibrio crassostreae]CAK2900701.1 hypothetical protein VCRA2121O264_320010 [Vibrio crassostreae]CAK3572459.1 hypothetical protein VCRA2121O262_330036 [Vibrio crassostreae]
MSEKFGTVLSEHLLEKGKHSSEQKKDMGAYVITDFYLSFFSLGIAITPGLLLSQFL